MKILSPEKSRPPSACCGGVAAPGEAAAEGGEQEPVAGEKSGASTGAAACNKAKGPLIVASFKRSDQDKHGQPYAARCALGGWSNGQPLWITWINPVARMHSSRE